jgi:LCP family protein required for cell wall assembly
MYGPGGGIQLTRETVGQLLNVPIDYVVQVDFSGFVAGIDAIGGVTIDVPNALYDGAYPTMDYGYQEVSFVPGTQDMDGARALIYARIRHMDSDVARMRRQQQVILAAIGKVRGQNMLAQLDTTARLAGALRSYVRFDIPEDRLVSLIWAFRNIQPAAVERYTLDENMSQENVVPEDPYAKYPLPGAIEQLAAKLMGT